VNGRLVPCSGRQCSPYQTARATARHKSSWSRQAWNDSAPVSMLIFTENVSSSRSSSAAEESAGLRWQALGWLRACLEVYRNRLAEGQPGERAEVPSRLRHWLRLRHWQQDDDLAGVHDDKALSALPADERGAWKKLWADVAALARKAEGKK
jgi:hypothetical protein